MIHLLRVLAVVSHCTTCLYSYLLDRWAKAMTAVSQWHNPPAPCTMPTCPPYIFLRMRRIKHFTTQRNDNRLRSCRCSRLSPKGCLMVSSAPTPTPMNFFNDETSCSALPCFFSLPHLVTACSLHPVLRLTPIPWLQKLVFLNHQKSCHKLGTL